MCDSKDILISEDDFIKAMMESYQLTEQEVRKLIRIFINSGDIERMPDGKTLKIIKDDDDDCCGGCDDCHCDKKKN